MWFFKTSPSARCATPTNIICICLYSCKKHASSSENTFSFPQQYLINCFVLAFSLASSFVRAYITDYLLLGCCQVKNLNCSYFCCIYCTKSLIRFYLRYTQTLTKFARSMKYVVDRNWRKPKRTEHGSYIEVHRQVSRSLLCSYASNFMLTCYVINGMLFSC
jgi:hypothetical protein